MISGIHGCLQGQIPTAAGSPARGLIWALGLSAAWIITLGLALSLPAAQLSPAGMVTLILIRSVLQTGLFIVGHDAMHGSLLPASPLWNERIGRTALGLYAWLPWDACCRSHRLHHQAPGSRLDPDHHDGQERGPVRWYLRFMASYLTAAQMGALLGTWLLCLAVMGPFTPQAPGRLLLFWSLPLLISSLQLFLVGTYLPHRDAAAISADRHRAASLRWPELLSLLACFHFGYHWEHHQHPQVPWYRLPAQRRLMTVPPPARSRLAVPQISR